PEPEVERHGRRRDQHHAPLRQGLHDCGPPEPGGSPAELGTPQQMLRPPVVVIGLRAPSRSSGEPTGSRRLLFPRRRGETPKPGRVTPPEPSVPGPWGRGCNRATGVAKRIPAMSPGPSWPPAHGAHPARDDRPRLTGIGRFVAVALWAVGLAGS